ncbi:MAG: hypothetical protein D6748_15670 [Calditrichaeota bacterium]|nr:MAG: hypothetical protein D6748_15670 [Calditrichota bacterium]
MGICETIKESHEKLLRRISIYPLKNDEDRDFEFYVFVDAGNENRRPLFLKALRVALGFDEKETSQITKQCQDEWNELFNKKEKQPSPEFSVLNWVKIAIEQYPYRLFVVIDPNHWIQNQQNPLNLKFWYEGEISDECWKLHTDENESFLTFAEDTRKWVRSKFLYKRICWIEIEEFEKVVPWIQGAEDVEYYSFPDLQETFQNIEPTEKAKGEFFKLWLYLKWIQHVFIRIRDIQKQKRLCLWFYQLHDISSQEKRYPPYFPSSLPKPFRTVEGAKFIQGCVLDFEEMSFKIIENIEKYFENEQNNSFVFCVFRRHGNVWELEDKKEAWELIMDFDSDPVLYGEYLTGTLSYLTRFLDATSASGAYSLQSANFVFSIAEQALFRLFLIDERIQEKYIKFTKQDAGYVLGQRIFISYLDQPNIYDQKRKPDKAIYSCISSQDKPELKICKNGNKNFEVLFKGDAIFPDCLIIHQGILDKWYNENKISIQNKILEWKESIPFLIVTSGRGTPSNLPRGVKFIPFSNLETCLIGSRFEKITAMKQFFILKERSV